MLALVMTSLEYEKILWPVLLRFTNKIYNPKGLLQFAVCLYDSNLNS